MANPFLRVVSPEISSFQMSKILGGGQAQIESILDQKAEKRTKLVHFCTMRRTKI